jgi:hypothetical protein|tara:strand:+ start:876 stop:1001 length:126 start_codon:yes stop_codon:yes gene_type:complete
MKIVVDILSYICYNSTTMKGGTNNPYFIVINHMILSKGEKL